MSAEILRRAASLTRAAAGKCCGCTDGHHDWTYIYGTEGDVRMSRDAALAVADWLDGASCNLHCDTDGKRSPYCSACEDSGWDHDCPPRETCAHTREYVRALAVARAYLGSDA